MTLINAKQGNEYKITGVGGGGNIKRRLLDLGFVPGAAVTFESVAPLGGSVLVSLRGCMVALRESAAALISISDYER